MVRTLAPKLPTVGPPSSSALGAAATMGRATRAAAAPMRRLALRAIPRAARATVWFGANKALVGLVVLAVLGATVGLAALLIRQDVTANPSASNAVVKFQNGSDYASINAAGFATITIPSSGSSATMAITGVSGAALTTLGNVLAINNTAAAQNYTVTLTRSGTVNAAILGLNVTVKDGASSLVVWNVVTSSSSGSFTHLSSRVLNMTVEMHIADGTSVGALGTFDMQFAFAPA